MSSMDESSMESKQLADPFQDRSLSEEIDMSDDKSICTALIKHTEQPITVTSERPSHTNTHTWRSRRTVIADNFDRMKGLVRHVAPEQFRDPARPSNGPCGIVPVTLLEYMEHSRDIYQMKTEQMQKNLAAKKEAQRVSQINRAGEKQAPIESAFGKHAKIYDDGLSPVLCRQTIWSEEYGQMTRDKVDWPTPSELQESGDSRENEHVTTRCGRYLPLPHHKVVLPPLKVLGMKDRKPLRLKIAKKQLPLDEHGPIFSDGPAPMTTIRANVIMNADSYFEGKGRFLVGEELMKEVGEKMAPFLPDWQNKRR